VAVVRNVSVEPVVPTPLPTLPPVSIRIPSRPLSMIVLWLMNESIGEEPPVA